MNTRDIEFLLAYIDVYGMQKRPLFEVCSEITSFFTEAMEATEGEFSKAGYIDSFIMQYNDMKKHGIEDKVKFYTMVLGYSLSDACVELGI